MEEPGKEPTSDGGHMSDLQRFHFGTCDMNSLSKVDLTAVAEAVYAVALNEIWDNDTLIVETGTVFQSGRLLHTNTTVYVTVESLAVAQRIRTEVCNRTGRRWSSPSQDPEDVEKGAGESWGMFTVDGARAVQAAVDKVEAQVRDGQFGLPLGPVRIVQENVAAQGFTEVGDTAVREELGAHFDRVLEEMGVTLDLG